MEKKRVKINIYINSMIYQFKNLFKCRKAKTIIILIYNIKNKINHNSQYLYNKQIIIKYHAIYLLID